MSRIVKGMSEDRIRETRDEQRREADEARRSAAPIGVWVDRKCVICGLTISCSRDYTQCHGCDEDIHRRGVHPPCHVSCLICGEHWCQECDPLNDDGACPECAKEERHEI